VVLLSVDLAATSGLFQSPPPTEELPPTEALPPPTETLPAPTWTVVPITPTEMLVITPTAQVAPTAIPIEIPPTATAMPLVPTAELAPSVTPALSEPEATAEEGGRYATEDSNLKFEWGMLFDSVALAASRIWLCCGVLLFILVPIFFIALWVTSRRHRQGEDQQRQE